MLTQQYLHLGHWNSYLQLLSIGQFILLYIHIFFLFGWFFSSNLYTNSNLYTQTCWSNQCNNCLRTKRILYLYKFSLVRWGTILSARSQCPARTGPSRVFSRLRTELGPRRYITGDWIISSGDSTRVVTFKFGSRHNHGRAYWFTTKLLHIYSWNMK